MKCSALNNGNSKHNGFISKKINIKNPIHFTIVLVLGSVRIKMRK